MRALLLEVPPALLEERRRLGLDKFDEMWEGLLHMPPPASGPHQVLGTDLLVVLVPLARRRGLVGRYESGLFHPGRDDDYRVPDQIYARPEQSSQRGVEAPAELVVEIRSAGDETYEKLDWYAARGVAEVLVVHPDTRQVELYRLRGDRLKRVQGEVVVEALGVRLTTVPGPRLHIEWDDGSAEV